MNISSPSHFRPHLNEEASTHITAHVLGVLGVFEVRSVNRKPVSSRQGALARVSVQILPNEKDGLKDIYM